MNAQTATAVAYPIVKKTEEYSGETYYEYRGFKIYRNKRESSGYYGAWYVNTGRLHSDGSRQACIEWIDRYIPKRDAELAEHKTKMEQFVRIVETVCADIEVKPIVYDRRNNPDVDLVDNDAFTVTVEWGYAVTHAVKVKPRNLSAEQMVELTGHMTRAVRIAWLIQGVIDAKA